MTRTYHAIGLMSGSSLDGLDVAYCKFEWVDGNLQWEMLDSVCLNYEEKWRNRLKKLYSQDALTFVKTHSNYGYYLGDIVKKFCEERGLKPDVVALHGHTVFHEPDNGFSTQVGCGAALAARSGIPTVTDFRNTDIANGGQGAPLVPVADRDLFAGRDFYLNIGGIVNISARKPDGQMVAYDVCAGNVAMNFSAAQLGMKYDIDGISAASGEINDWLFDELNSEDYFRVPYPKSLSNKWVQSRVIPLLIKARMAPDDKLATLAEHIAYRVAEAVDGLRNREGLGSGPFKMMLTGGGVFNRHIVKRLQYHLQNVEMEVPSNELINFKEAIMMAYLGVLRMEGMPGSLASVTGASKDCISGAIYMP